MGAGADAARERDRREADADAVPAGNAAQQDASQHKLVGGCHRRGGRQRDFKLVDAVLGMKLFDIDPGRRHGVDHIADEFLVLKHSGQSVLGPQLSG